MEQELFSFIDEHPEKQATIMQRPWKVLSVEDDYAYQEALSLSLESIQLGNRSIKLLKAASATEAAHILSQYDDIALILLDVIMETDDAGLRLVETIRNSLGNQTVRIVILTGQPGAVPRDEVIRKYDINEYWEKTALKDKIQSIIITNLRSWQALRELEEARTGLQMVVDSLRSISNRINIDEFALTVLNEISRILNLSEKEGGIICAQSRKGKLPKIITACGRFSNLIGKESDQVHDDTIKKLISNAVMKKDHVFREKFSVFYFEVKETATDEDIDAYLMIVAEETPLSDSHVHLLKIFAENVSTGFSNIYLNNRLRQMAFYDRETGLPNRNWLKRELSLLRDDELESGTLLLFRIHNHFIRHLHLGAEFAAQVITKIIKELQNQFSEVDVVVRFSQDILAILCRNKEQLRLMEDKTREMSMHLDVNGISTTIFYNLVYMNLNDFPDMNADELIKTAWSAVSETSQSRDWFVNYGSEKVTNAIREFQLVNMLEPALDKEEMYLALQPKVDLLSRHPVGFEGLIRWKRPDGTIITPREFIPAAEKAGMIHQLDIFVLQESVRLQEILCHEGWQLPISFNATVMDLKNQQYLSALDKVLNSDSIAHSLLELEITETGAMDCYDDFEPLFFNIRKAGMNIALDDFGTGYSSLQHLARIPASTIKIDQSFIQKMAADNTEMHVVELVIKMAQRLKFKLIAEGVETELQAETLRQLGCSIGQGYLYGKPMPIEDIILWLEQYREIKYSVLYSKSNM